MGVRSSSTHNSYNTTTPQLGAMVKENGEKVVDYSYYAKKDEKISKDITSYRDKIEKLQQLRDGLVNAEQQIDYENAANGKNRSR